MKRENGAAAVVPMTEGSIGKRLVLFAVPVFLGNLFQQLYNAMDSLIVGNFLGSQALAAVASSGSVIFLMIGFFNGMFIGAGIVIARYYGAKDRQGVQKSLHTALALAVAAGVFLTAFGMTMAPVILRWMGTPEDVFPNSVAYFRTYFAGSLAFVLYNACVGILQSVGDSRHPLYYLMLSSVINGILDLFFIGILHQGVWSAALGTIIAQSVSAVLCLVRLVRGPEEYRVYPKLVRFYQGYLWEIVKNGFPAGIQNCMISLANVVVQANINAFGSLAMAGCGAYSRVENFAFLPINSFSMAMATFVSQNRGAGRYDRVKKGAVFGTCCGVLLAELVGILYFSFAPLIIAVFDSNPQVIAMGTLQARTECMFYFLLAFSHCSAGILRGAGRSYIPMAVMLCIWCVFRIIYITAVIRIIPEIQMIFTAYPLTWAMSSVVFAVYLWKSNWIRGYV